MPRISYQLYCSRNFPPLGDTLQMLAQAGYTDVEGYGGLLGDLDGLRAALDTHGIAMTSCHIGLEQIEDDLTGTLALIRTLGIGKVFAPFIAPEDRPTDAAGWTAFGKRLAEAGKPLQDAGIVFGWHNHAFELDPTDTGEVPLDLIAQASDDLMLELDLGWVRVAGLDPVERIGAYAGRISAVHIKDIAPDGDCADEDGWADIGHGIMDWAGIHKALQNAGVVHYVVEHDNPNDHVRFATRSLAAIRNF